jgi:hypothetical protein
VYLKPQMIERNAQQSPIMPAKAGLDECGQISKLSHMRPCQGTFHFMLN